MSLVNEVLRDLQHRRDSSTDTGGLVAADGAFGQRRLAPRWLLAGAAAVTLGLGAFALERWLADAPSAAAPAEAATPQEPPPQPQPQPLAAQPIPGIAAAAVEPEPVVDLAPEPEPEPEPEPVAEADEPPPAAARTEPDPAPVMQRTLVTTTPRERADAAYADGVRALSEGRRGQAEADFTTALGHDATLFPARLALANVLAGNGQLREAEIQLQEGLRISPAAWPLAERFARLLYERGDLAGAIGVLRSAPPPLAERPDYHALLAALQQRAGNHAAAADVYAALVEVRPAQGLWWLGLGLSLEADGRTPAALNAYRRAADDPRLSTEVAAFVRERVAVLDAAGGAR